MCKKFTHYINASVKILHFARFYTKLADFTQIVVFYCTFLYIISVLNERQERGQQYEIYIKRN